MNPPMFERVRNMFQAAGLNDGRIVQLTFFEDTKKASDAFIVFRPNNGIGIPNSDSGEHYVLVDVIGPKDKRSLTTSASQAILDYVEKHPLSDKYVGQIQAISFLPPPVLTDEGRPVYRLQFACLYGE
ncbi:phage tail termination protein [Buttiauxella sp.]|uniref:phage tail termination protein n=1 Tax=Buttiauxella sp. TaxID=1972222 RepID=UPI003C7923A9